MGGARKIVIMRVKGGSREEREVNSSKRINVRVSSSAAQMNPDTDFSMEENLINIKILHAMFHVQSDLRTWIPDNKTAM